MQGTILKQPEELSISHPGAEQVLLPTCERLSLCDCACWGVRAPPQPVSACVHGVTQGAGAPASHVNIGSKV